MVEVEQREKPGRCSRRQFTLAGVMGLLLFPLIALGDGKTGFAGSYESDPDKPTPSMAVSLGEDSTATVTEDPVNDPTVLFGHWTDIGGQVKITFDPVDGKPGDPPMILEPGHDGLHAVTWNHTRWGKVIPPFMKKGGYKPKQSYWFTTVP